MNAVISIENLRKQYGDFTLDIPKLEVKKGYITGFIGENGSGKTTTLRLIMDAIIPDSGEITVLGANIHKKRDKIVPDIGFVENQSCFVSTFRIKQIRQMVAPFFSTWDDELFSGYCKRFGLKADSKVKSLSSGEQRLLSLAVALAHRPKLLLLDEPTSSLDPLKRTEILELFGELLMDGETSIFYSTHITSDLDKTADYIVYIKDGQIILQAEKDQLLNQYILVKGENSLLEGHIDCPLLGTRKTSVGFTALCPNREKAHQMFQDRVAYEKPNIEDIMVYVAKEEQLHA